MRQLRGETTTGSTDPPETAHRDSDRVRRDLLIAGTTTLLAILVLLAAGIAAEVLGVPFPEFLVDPASKDGAHIGLLSMAGVLVWGAAGSIALFSGLAGGPAGDRRFLTSFGAFVLLLTADDAFLIHDGIVPRLTGIGPLEYVVFAFYLAAAVALGVHFRPELRVQAPWWLLAGVAMLCSSILIDVIGHPGQILHAVKPLEDAPKFIGIALTSSWLIRTTAIVVHRQRAGPEQPSAPSLHQTLTRDVSSTVS